MTQKVSYDTILAYLYIGEEKFIVASVHQWWPVGKFLFKVKAILDAKDFNKSTQFLFIPRQNNLQTLFDMELEEDDVIDVIKNLEECAGDKVEADRYADKKTPVYVFLRQVNGRQLYIKLKLTGATSKIIVCVSFHESNC